MYFSGDAISISVMTKKGGVIVKEDCKVIRGRSKIFIGKQEDNDVLSLHPSVSRLHTCLVVTEVYEAYLIDLASANGTTVDQVALSPFVPARLNLTVGSEIVVGASSRTIHFHIDLLVAERQRLGVVVYY